MADGQRSWSSQGAIAGAPPAFEAEQVLYGALEPDRGGALRRPRESGRRQGRATTPMSCGFIAERHVRRSRCRPKVRAATSPPCRPAWSIRPAQASRLTIEARHKGGGFRHGADRGQMVEHMKSLPSAEQFGDGLEPVDQRPRQPDACYQDDGHVEHHREGTDASTGSVAPVGRRKPVTGAAGSSAPNATTSRRPGEAPATGRARRWMSPPGTRS